MFAWCHPGLEVDHPAAAQEPSWVPAFAGMTPRGPKLRAHSGFVAAKSRLQNSGSTFDP